METDKRKCEFCYNLDPGADLSRDPSTGQMVIRGVTTDLRTVQSRSAEGCRFCPILEQALATLKPDWRDTGDGACRKVAHHMPGTPNDRCDCHSFRLVQMERSVVLVYPCKDVSEDKAGCHGNGIELYISDGEPRPLEELDAHDGKRPTDLSTRFRLARSWIDRCRAEHDCEEPIQFAFKGGRNHTTTSSNADGDFTLHISTVQRHVEKKFSSPPRILDIRDFAERKKIRLLEGSAMVDTTYACLSYCWGTQNTCLTTRANVGRFLVDIPLEILPRTYKDAVAVASGLGIPYLWIDALCIIQDDIDCNDWKQHAGQMGDIYGNSIVTIAAVNASGTSEGFLKSTGPSAEHLVFRSTPPSPETSRSACAAQPLLDVYARRLPDHVWLVSDRWGAKDLIASNPLWSRAWCFQEEFLPPRVLGFYGQEMIFQCQKDYHCECGFRHRDPPGVETLRSTKSVLATPFNSKVEKTANQLWDFLVWNYGRRKLTFVTDRLPALSGVARLVQGLLGARYLAGHWDDDTLLTSLCWSATDQAPTPHFADYVAPSWSWASFGRGITRNNALHDHYTLAQGTELLAAETRLATQDPTGAVLGGHLVVRGAFLDVVVVKTDNGLVMERNGISLPFSLDWELRPVSSAVKPRILCWSHKSSLDWFVSA